MTNGMTAQPPTTAHPEAALPRHSDPAHYEAPTRSDARRLRMAVPLSLGPVHHLRLTVTDVERSRAFYTELLGFQIAMDTPPPADDPYHDLATDLLQDGIVMVNGNLLLGLRPVDTARARDRFDPFRCGLDHLSFAVADRAELEAAAQAFTERGVEHSDITDLPPFSIAVLPFKDPDGMALELTAPL
jgi:glyoxylase I family protein